MLAPVAAALAAATLAACGGAVEPEAAPPQEAAAGPAAQPPSADPPAEAPAVEVEAPLLRQGFDGSCYLNVPDAPCGPGVAVGSHWTYEIYTHCGIQWIYLDGRFWRPDPVMPDFNPPEGWGNPVDEGVLTLEDAERALYLSQGGDQVVFVPAPAEYEPPLCQ
jgi:hypothetical protein